MKRRPHIAILILITGFVAAGALTWYVAMRPQSLCRNLSCISLQTIEMYRPKDIYTDTPTTYRALFTEDHRLIRIEARRVPASEAPKELEAAIARVNGMFAKAPAPYPGEVSDAIVCDPALAPSFHTTQSANGPIPYFIGFLNDRLTFGSCSQNQATYRGLMAFTYCPTKSILLHIELIETAPAFSEETAVKMIQTLACR